jgi:hypothetical protein
VQKLFNDYAEAAGIKKRSVDALCHSMAVHLLEAGRRIEYVADHLGHKNIQNTRIYAQLTNPFREQVFREGVWGVGPECRLIGGDCEPNHEHVGAEWEPKTPLVCGPPQLGVTTAIDV